MDGSGSEVSECNIQVFVRIRPPVEEEPSYSRVVDVSDDDTQIILKQAQTPRLFKFDHVANIEARQESIFAKLGRKVIENCISGYNGTIFAYGQTGSGKTFTMLGPSEGTENFQDELRGVIPRSFEYLFALIRREKEIHGENKQFLCKCSFLEIYNEQIFDLLEPSAQVLHLRESLKSGVYVNGLSEQVVSDAAEAFQLLNASWVNRRVASTSMNRESSRSHAVFTMTIESKERKDGAWTIKTSQLNLVDLAGSESQKNTNATGLRLKEAGSINKSLSNLGNCINALSNGRRDGKERHVPYRDSKLTFLLRASLGGNAKTSLIACVHSGHKYYAETLSTLQFAQRAKMIKNKAILNENAQQTVEQLLAQIKNLKEQLTAFKSGSTIPQAVSSGEMTAANPDDPAQQQTEPMPELKKKFLKAMAFYQKSETEKMELEKKLSESKRHSDNALRQKEMIIKFRNEEIKRLKGKSGQEEPDKTVEHLQQEVTMLREENTNHPLVKKYSADIQVLQRQLQTMRSSEDWLARVEANHKLAMELEEMYKQLLTDQKIADNDGLTTPKGSEMISTATVEKLRTHNKDLEANVALLNQALNDVREDLQEKEKRFKKEKEEFEKTIRDLNTIISANDLKAKIEKEEMTKKHLETVITITTPKKERYKLRSRTVVSQTDSPLDISIPFEDSSESEGIMEEGPPDMVIEQANEALCEQIKQQREQISNHEMRISEYDRDRIQMSQQVSRLEAELCQVQEQLEKEKKKDLTAREKIMSLENIIRDNQTTIACNSDEIKDLRMVLNSADNELKDAKSKNKTLEASVQEEKEAFTTQLEKMERKLEELEKENEKFIEEKETLKNDLDVEKTTSSFHANLCLQLEGNLKDKKHEIEQLLSSLQDLEKQLNDERLLHENQSNLLSSEGMQKEQLYLDQCAANEQLMAQITDLTEQVKKTTDAEERLKKFTEQMQETINQQYKKLREASEEQEDLRQKNTSLEEELGISKQDAEDNLETIRILQEKMESMKEMFENERKKEEVKIDMLKEDLFTIQALEEEQKEEIKSLQEKLDETEKRTLELEKEKKDLEETIEQSKEQARSELSSKEISYAEATKTITSLTTLAMQRKDENEELKKMMEQANDANHRLSRQLEDSKYSNSELQERATNQEEALSELRSEMTIYKTEAQSLKLDLDQREKELSAAQDELQLMDRLKQDKLQLEETVIRLKELANRDEEEKKELTFELDRHTNEIKKIQSMFTGSEGPSEPFDLGFVFEKIRDINAERDKLLEENTALVGHSNHRQKIKYHEQVKNENQHLKQKVVELDKDVNIWRLKYQHLHEEMVKKGLKTQERPMPLAQLDLGKENARPQQRMFLSGDYTKRS